MPNTLYFGNNLHVLRQYVPDASVDLVYLDPPFNSNAGYNVLFKSPVGDRSRAQAKAFEDTWHWGEEAELAYSEVLRSGSSAGGILRALRGFLGESDLMAYLAMMAIRLLELRRVMKRTGSLYLHCDPTAGHYLKILLDGILGQENFRNEIVWKRTGSHGSSKRWGPVHDTILFYTFSGEYTWNRISQSYESGYLEEKYRHTDERGAFQDVSLTGAGIRKGDSGLPWRGHNPTAKGRHWAISVAAGERIPGYANMTPQEKLDVLDSNGLIYWPRKKREGDSFPRMKQYPADGIPIQDCITDISAINSQAQERLGYPTQKPITLLDRIVRASSRPGDVVLDPFCGCGTAIHAAQKLDRKWIGIDITHIAIQIIEDRLRKYFPAENCRIIGRPTDIEGARDLARRDKHEFQSWAVWLAGGWPVGGVEKKGMDRGVDGEFYFKLSGDHDGRAIISVKGGQHIGPQMIRDLKGTREREDAEMGIFLSLEPPTAEMRREAATAGFLDNDDEAPIARIQLFTVDELLSGASSSRRPAMYDTVTAAVAGRRADRARPAKAPTPEELRNAPRLKLPISGGKKQTQTSLTLSEAVPDVTRTAPIRRRRVN